jgi:hypothetical protein
MIATVYENGKAQIELWDNYNRAMKLASRLQRKLTLYREWIDVVGEIDPALVDDCYTQAEIRVELINKEIYDAGRENTNLGTEADEADADRAAPEANDLGE